MMRKRGEEAANVNVAYASCSTTTRTHHDVIMPQPTGNTSSSWLT